MRAKLQTLAAAALLALLVNSGYLSAFPAPTLFYGSNVLLHLALGVLLVLLWPLVPAPMTLALATGGALAVVGAQTPYRWLLVLHIVCCVVAAGAIAWKWRSLNPRLYRGFLACAAAALALPAASGIRSRF